MDETEVNLPYALTFRILTQSLGDDFVKRDKVLKRNPGGLNLMRVSVSQFFHAMEYADRQLLPAARAEVIRLF